jgi:nucleotide-binding universal stress UspA family protein
MQRVEITGGVAAGVDGSVASRRALQEAADEAARRNVVLHVVRAWSMRTAPRPSGCPANVVPSVDDYQEAVREETEHLVASELGSPPRCEVQLHVVHSPAPQVLLSASQGAELLVVGHRGRGGFAELMLGSVAEQCVRHAACPVLVVRPRS